MSFIPMGFYKTPSGGTPPFVPTDADAGAYITQVESVGGTLTTTEKEAIDNLYLDLKGAGSLENIYAGISLFYPFMGGTPDSHAVEGANPTDSLATITWGGTLTNTSNHTSAGVNIFATETAYGDIGYSALDKFNNINASMGWYYSDAVSGNGFIIGQQAGSVGSTDRFEGYHETNGTTSGIAYSTIGEPKFASYNTPGVPTGRWIGNRYGSTIMNLWLDGRKVNTNTENNTGTRNNNDFRFFNADASLLNQVRGTYGFLFLASDLTDTQVISLDTSIKNFLTAIGRDSGIPDGVPLTDLTAFTNPFEYIGSGNNLDETSNGNDFTLGGAQFNTYGAVDNFDYGQTDNSINVNNNPFSGAGSRSVAMWFRGGQFDSIGLFSTGNWGWYVDSNAKFVVSANGNTSATNLDLPFAQWNFYVFTFDGTSLSDNTIYFYDSSGNLSTHSATGASAVNTTGTDWWMGRSPNNSYFDGKIAHTAWYNRLISTTEATNFYNATKAFYGQ